MRSPCVLSVVLIIGGVCRDKLLRKNKIKQDKKKYYGKKKSTKPSPNGRLKTPRTKGSCRDSYKRRKKSLCRYFFSFVQKRGSSLDGPTICGGGSLSWPFFCFFKEWSILMSRVFEKRGLSMFKQPRIVSLPYSWVLVSLCRHPEQFGVFCSRKTIPHHGQLGSEWKGNETKARCFMCFLLRSIHGLFVLLSPRRHKDFLRTPTSVLLCPVRVRFVSSGLCVTSVSSIHLVGVHGLRDFWSRTCLCLVSLKKEP